MKKRLVRALLLCWAALAFVNSAWAEEATALKGLTVSEAQAEVSFTCGEPARLIVGVYDGDTGAMTASGGVTVQPGQKTAAVPLSGPLPENFTASAFLTGAETARPLCEKYTVDSRSPKGSSVYAALFDGGELEFYSADSASQLDLGGRTPKQVQEVTPWWQAPTEITRVTFVDRIQPESARRWFYECGQLREVRQIENLDTSRTTNLSGMFWGCGALAELNVSGFDTRNVTDMSLMFTNCASLTELDVSHFDTHNVTDLRSMFLGCGGLTALDVSGFETRNVTDMSGMFSGCGSLTRVDGLDLETGNVRNLYQMFYECASLTELDLSGFDTRNVTNMGMMFYGCAGLTELDLKNFDTRNVTNMRTMFFGCLRLESLNVSSFDTGKVKDMAYMFASTSVKTLDLSGFDTAAVTNMSRMFAGCSRLRTIYASERFVCPDNAKEMFLDCLSLMGDISSHYQNMPASNRSQSLYAHLDGGVNNPGYFTRKRS